MYNRIMLSIVIPTKNRVALLKGVLESIVRQPADPDVFEVLVIDNGSTDETREVAKSFQKKIKNFRYFYDARPGLHVGRNKGLLKSRGELIGYLDDDVILFPNWINTVLEAFEDEQTMCMEGSVVPFDMSLLTKDFRDKYEVRQGTFRFIYSISCFWEDGIAEDDMRIHRAPAGSFFGANIVYRKSVLLACKGFHPDGMPNNLLMYRGDGESYVGQYIKEHRMKMMYYAQASVYHMINADRVTDSYINYMHFRKGISNMYTNLRSNGLKGGAIRFWYILCEVIVTGKISKQIGGELYLLFYYVLYERIRHWVHKADYF